MAFGSSSTLQQEDGVAAVAASGGSAVGGGGGGAGSWDDLSGTLSGNVPFETVDRDGNPAPRGASFIGAGEDIQWQRDPAGDLAFEVRDTTNGNRLLWLDDNGRLHTRRDQEAFADGGGSAASGVNSLLQVEDAGTVLTTDAASLNFTGSGLSISQNGDDVTIDVSGGSGSDIDIEQNQTPVVGGATGLSFEGSGVDDVTNDGDGTATVSISKGSSTEVQQGGTQQVSDVTTLDFVNDFSVSNPNGGEAEVSLANDTVTVAGNSVNLGGSTSIGHGDLNGIGSADHHAVFEPSDYTPVSDVGASTPFSNSDLSNSIVTVAGNSVALGNSTGIDHGDLGAISSDDHHAVFEPADYNPVADVEAQTSISVDISGDADTLDGAEGSAYARLGQDETVNGFWKYTTGINIAENPIGRGPTFSTLSYDGLTIPQYGAVWDQGSSDNNPRAHISGFDGVTLYSNASPQIKLDRFGNTGLGGVTTPSYTIEAAGDIRGTGEVEAFLGSDRRLKTNITPVESALDKVAELTGSRFQWHESDSVQPHKRGEADVGLIAQDVEDVLPEAVTTFEDGHSEGYKAVQYDKVVPLLVEAIKDLRSQLQELR